MPCSNRFLPFVLLALLLLGAVLFVGCAGDSPTVTPIALARTATVTTLVASNPPSATLTVAATPSRIPTATIIPSKTPTKTPRPTQTPTTQSFPNSPLFRPEPEDILRQVYYYVTGGPIGCNSAKYQAPVVEAPRSDVDEGEPVTILVCGWPTAEMVTIELRRPGSNSAEIFRTNTEELRSGVQGISYAFAAELTGAPGLYKIAIRGQQQELHYEFFLQRPGETYPRAAVDDDLLLLRGFAAHESIRILAYTVIGDDSELNYKTLQLLAWDSYRVNNAGELNVNLGVEAAYVIIGDISGQVKPPNDENALVFVTVDGGVLAKSFVIIAGSGSLAIRDAPSLTTSVVAYAPAGTRLRTIGQTIVVDGSTWWLIQLEDGTEGWVLELEVQSVID